MHYKTVTDPADRAARLETLYRFEGDNVAENFRGWLERQLRLRQMSQAEFSRRGGVSVSTTSQYLNGSRGAGEQLYRAVARALGMPLDEVLRVAGVLPAASGDGELSGEDRYILEQVRRLSPVRRRQLIEYLEFLAVRSEGGE